jgi:filamentous hemagglutinin family protein
MSTARNRIALRRTLWVTTALAGGALTATTPAWAQTLPGGGTVVGGDATIGTPTPSGSGQALGIQTNTNRSIINWESFSIGANDSVNFTNGVTNPADRVAILNRVIGTGGVIPRSEILGSLTSSSNISVYLLNPTGIVFGAGANVNVGGLVASSLDIGDADFLDGDNSFSFSGATPSVDGDGGVAALAGSTINSGEIVAFLGHFVNSSAAIGGTSAPENAAFVAASDVVMTAAPGSPLSLTINQGTALNTGVVVGGTVNGQNVYVGLATRTGITDAVLNISGVVTATTATATDRGIVLAAGTSATGVTVDSGGDTGGAARVAIDGALERLVADDGGAAANNASIEVRARGGVSGTGGILADDQITVQSDAGNINLTGAITSGDDTSLSAAAGDVTVANLTVGGDYAVTGQDFGAGDALSPTFVGSGNDFTITDTQGGLSGAFTAPGTLTINVLAGDLTITGPTASSNEDVVLSATNPGARINLQGSVTTGTGLGRFVSLVAADSVTQNAAGIVTTNEVRGSAGSTFDLNDADNVIAAVGDVTADGVFVRDTGSFSAAGLINAGAGGIDLQGGTGAGDELAVTGTLTTADTGDITLGAGGGVELDGADISAAAGDVLFEDAVTLATSTSNNVQGGTVAFQGNVDGAGGLSVTSTGGTSFASAIGATTPLASLSLTGPATLNNSVSTTGTQSYGALTLAGDVTLTSTGVGAAGDISLAGVTGNQSLTINTGGTTRLAGDVTVGGISTDAPGSTVIDTALVQTTGNQSWGDSVTLNRTTRFRGVDGSFQGLQAGVSDVDVRLSFTGQTTLNLAPTGFKDITSDDGGSTVLNGAITTTGAQSFADAVTLGSDVMLTSSGNGAITLAAVTGNQALSVSTGGAMTFGGAIGGADGTTAPTSLSAGGGGTIALNGGSVRTSGAQSYSGAVTLGADTTLTSSGGGAIQFTGTVDGTQALTVTSSGDTTFDGAVGGTTALRAITTNGGGRTLVNGGLVRTVTAAGGFAQDFQDNVVLGAAALFEAPGSIADIRFGGTVTGPFDLTVATDDLTLFGGTVDVASVTSNLGFTRIDGGAVTTSGNQSYGTVTLGSASTALNATGMGSTIAFGGAVNGITAGGQALTVTAANIQARDMGNLVALDSLTMTGATRLSSTIVVDGPFVQNGDLTLADGDHSITADSTVFDGTINGTTAGNANLTVTADTTSNAFNGAIGDSVRLGTLIANSVTSTSFGGAVNANFLGVDAASVTFAATNQVDTLAADVDNGPLTFANGRALTIGTVGALTGVTVGAGDVSISANGNLSLAQAVTANAAGGADVSLTATGGLLSGAGLVTGDAVSLTGGSGVGIGTGDRVNTAATTLSVNGGSGSVFVAESDGVTLQGTNQAGIRYDLTVGGALTLTGTITAQDIALAAQDFLSLDDSELAETRDLSLTDTLGGGSFSGLTAQRNLTLASTGAGAGLTVDSASAGVQGSGVGDLSITSAGAMTLTGAIDAAGDTVTLTAGGTITQFSAGANVIRAQRLTGSSVGGASLASGNEVVTLDDFANTVSGPFSFSNSGPLSVIGDVSSAGRVFIGTTGASGTLTVTNTGTVTGTGTFADLEGVELRSEASDLQIDGAVTNIAGDVRLESLGLGGSITLGGDVTAGGTLVLSANSIGQTPATSVLDVGTLNVQAFGAVSLDGANLIDSLGLSSSGAAGFNLTNAQTLTVAGPLSSNGGDIRLRVTGATGGNGHDLVLGGNINAGAGTVRLQTNADGDINSAADNAANIQQTGGVITALQVTGIADGSISLGSNNAVQQLGGVTARGISFRGGEGVPGGLTVVGPVQSLGATTGAEIFGRGGLTVNGPVSAEGSRLLLEAQIGGPLAINAPVSNPTGEVRLVTASGDVSQDAAGVITANLLTGSANGATDLDNALNDIATLGAFSADGFALRDESADLNVTGPVEGGSGALGILLDSGTMTLAGNIETDSVARGDAADGGDVVLTVTSGGLNQTAGRISSGEDILLSADSVTLTSTADGDDIAIDGRAGPIVTAALTARDDIALRTTGTITTGALTGGAAPVVDADGTADTLAGMTLAGNDIDIAGNGVTLNGRAQANGAGSDIRIDSGTGETGTSALDLDLAAGGDIVITGTANGRDVALSAGGLIDADRIVAADDLAIRAVSTVTTGDLTAGSMGGAASVAGAADTLAGATLAGNSIDIVGTTISIGRARAFGAASQIRLAGDVMGAPGDASDTCGPDICIDSDGDVIITGATTGRDVAIRAGNSLSAQAISANDDIALRAGAALTATDLTSGAATAVDVDGSADALAAPALLAGNDIDLRGGSVVLSSATANNAGGDLNIASTAGRIEISTAGSGVDIALNAAGGPVVVGMLTARDDLAIRGTGAVTASGTLTSGSGMATDDQDGVADMLAGATLDDGNIFVAATGAITAADLVSGADIALGSGGNVLTGNQTARDDVVIRAAGSVAAGAISSGSPANSDDPVGAGERLLAERGETQSLAGHDIDIRGNGLRLGAPRANAGGTGRSDVRLDSGSGEVGVPGSGEDLDIRADGDIVIAGTIRARDVALDAGGLVDVDDVFADDDIAMSVAETISTGALMAGDQDALGAADDLGLQIFAGTDLTGGGNIFLFADSAVTTGAITADFDVAIRAGTGASIATGAIGAGDDIVLAAGGTVTAGALTAGATERTRGTPGPNGAADLLAQSLTDFGTADLVGGGNVLLDSTIGSINAGAIAADLDVAVRAGTSIDVGAIAAGDDLVLSAGSDIDTAALTSGSRERTLMTDRSAGVADLLAGLELAGTSLVGGGTVFADAGASIEVVGVTTSDYDAALRAGTSISTRDIQAGDEVVLLAGTSVGTGTLTSGGIERSAGDRGSGAGDVLTRTRLPGANLTGGGDIFADALAGGITTDAVAADYDVALRAGQAIGTGTISAGDDIVLSAGAGIVAAALTSRDAERSGTGNRANAAGDELARTIPDFAPNLPGFAGASLTDGGNILADAGAGVTVSGATLADFDVAIRAATNIVVQPVMAGDDIALRAGGNIVATSLASNALEATVGARGNGVADILTRTTLSGADLTGGGNVFADADGDIDANDAITADIDIALRADGFIETEAQTARDDIVLRAGGAVRTQALRTGAEMSIDREGAGDTLAAAESLTDDLAADPLDGNDVNVRGSSVQVVSATTGAAVPAALGEQSDLRLQATAGRLELGTGTVGGRALIDKRGAADELQVTSLTTGAAEGAIGDAILLSATDVRAGTVEAAGGDITVRAGEQVTSVARDGAGAFTIVSTGVADGAVTGLAVSSDSGALDATRGRAVLRAVRANGVAAPADSDRSVTVTAGGLVQLGAIVAGQDVSISAGSSAVADRDGAIDISSINRLAADGSLTSTRGALTLTAFNDSADPARAADIRLGTRVTDRGSPEQEGVSDAAAADSRIGTTVTIRTLGRGGAAADALRNDVVVGRSLTAGGDVLLASRRDVRLGAAPFALTSTGGNVTIQADRNVTGLRRAQDGATGEALAMGGELRAGNVTSAGLIDVDAAGNVRLRNATSSAGDIDVDAGGSVTGLSASDGGDGIAEAGRVFAAGDVTVTAGPTARLSEIGAGDDISVGAGVVAVGSANAGGDLSLIAGRGLHLGTGGAGATTVLRTTGSGDRGQADPASDTDMLAAGYGVANLAASANMRTISVTAGLDTPGSPSFGVAQLGTVTAGASATPADGDQIAVVADGVTVQSATARNGGLALTARAGGLYLNTGSAGTTATLIKQDVDGNGLTDAQRNRDELRVRTSLASGTAAGALPPARGDILIDSATDARLPGSSDPAQRGTGDGVRFVRSLTGSINVDVVRDVTGIAPIPLVPTAEELRIASITGGGSISIGAASDDVRIGSATSQAGDVAVSAGGSVTGLANDDALTNVGADLFAARDIDVGAGERAAFGTLEAGRDIAVGAGVVSIGSAEAGRELDLEARTALSLDQAQVGGPTSITTSGGTARAENPTSLTDRLVGDYGFANLAASADNRTVTVTAGLVTPGAAAFGVGQLGTVTAGGSPVAANVDQIVLTADGLTVQNADARNGGLVLTARSGGLYLGTGQAGTQALLDKRDSDGNGLSAAEQDRDEIRVRTALTTGTATGANGQALIISATDARLARVEARGGDIDVRTGETVGDADRSRAADGSFVVARRATGDGDVTGLTVASDSGALDAAHGRALLSAVRATGAAANSDTDRSVSVTAGGLVQLGAVVAGQDVTVTAGTASVPARDGAIDISSVNRLGADGAPVATRGALSLTAFNDSNDAARLADVRLGTVIADRGAAEQPGVTDAGAADSRIGTTVRMETAGRGGSAADAPQNDVVIGRTLTAGGNVELISRRDVRLAADPFELRSTGGDVTVSASRNLTGLIRADDGLVGAARVNGGELRARLVNSGGDVRIVVGGTLAGDALTVTGPGNVRLGDVNSANGNIAVDAGGSVTGLANADPGDTVARAGRIFAGGDVTITAGPTARATDIGAGRDISISAGTIAVEDADAGRNATMLAGSGLHVGTSDADGATLLATAQGGAAVEPTPGQLGAPAAADRDTLDTGHGFAKLVARDDADARNKSVRVGAGLSTSGEATRGAAQLGTVRAGTVASGQTETASAAPGVTVVADRLTVQNAEAVNGELRLTAVEGPLYLGTGSAGSQALLSKRGTTDELRVRTSLTTGTGTGAPSDATIVTATDARLGAVTARGGSIDIRAGEVIADADVGRAGNGAFTVVRRPTRDGDVTGLAVAAATAPVGLDAASGRATLTAGNAVDIRAGGLVQAGTVSAGSSINVEAGSESIADRDGAIDISTAAAQAGSLTLTAFNNDTAKPAGIRLGTQDAAGVAQLDTAAADSRAGTTARIETRGTAGDIVVAQSLLAGGDVTLGSVRDVRLGAAADGAADADPEAIRSTSGSISVTAARDVTGLAALDGDIGEAGRAQSGLRAGNVTGAGDITIEGAGNVRLRNVTSRTEDVVVTAGGSITGLANDDSGDPISGAGRLLAGGNVSVTAGSLARVTRVVAGQNATVNATTVAVGATNAGGNVAMTASGTGLHAGTSEAGGTTTLRVQTAGTLATPPAGDLGNPAAANLDTLATTHGRANLTAQAANKTIAVTAGTQTPAADALGVAQLGTVAAGAGTGAATGNQIAVTADRLTVSSATASNGAIVLTARDGSLFLDNGSAGTSATLTKQGAFAENGAQTGNELRVRGTLTAGTATGAAGNVTIDSATDARLGTVVGRSGTVAVTAARDVTGLRLAANASGRGGDLAHGGANLRNEGTALDVNVTAGELAQFGTVAAGRAINVASNSIEIIGGLTAPTVTLTNRPVRSNATRIGGTDTANDNRTGLYVLRTEEMNRISGANVTIQSGAQNVEVQNLALNPGVGTSRLNLLTTARVDVTGTLTAENTTGDRTIQIGGTAGARTPENPATLASVLAVVPGSTGGGRLLAGNANLDLRANFIGVGLAAFLSEIGLNPGGTPASSDTVNNQFIAQPNSTLYVASLGVPYQDQVVLTANRLLVSYGNYALFQNTAPNLAPPNGVQIAELGTQGQLNLSSTGDTAPNGFALFGRINGIGGNQAALLGPTAIPLEDVNRSNTRVNGCLVGSGGGGCLVSNVSTPPVNQFDEGEANILQSAEDLEDRFAPIVGTNNEALFTGISSIDELVEPEVDCETDPDNPQCAAARPDPAAAREGVTQ